MTAEYQLKIAVCDDDPQDRLRSISMTEKILGETGVIYHISVYEKAEALLADLERGAQIHILLLDVMMDGIDGMALARQLRAQKNKCSIIFISSNREMALYGYEVSAIRYLAKPLEEHRLREALTHALVSWQEKKEILLPTDQGAHRISVSDIQFVEAFERGSRFVLANETVDARLKLSEAAELLPKPVFLLCHRAYIVNLSRVKHIRPYAFSLAGGETIPIGKARYSQIRKEFVDYIADSSSGIATVTL